MTESREGVTQDPHSLAELTQLAGGLAHELRNPLSTIMINLKLLEEQLRDEAAHPDDMRRRALLKVETLRREAGRLQALFDDFLQLTGPRRLKPKRVELEAVVQRLLEFLEPVLESSSVGVEFSRPDASVAAVVDEPLLSQALLNLLLNAQQAMPDGGTLRVVLTADADWCVLVISDTGIGIAPADRERIFAPFYSTKSKGTGLGLSITRRIILEHGGLLACESELGKGTSMTVRLPLRGFAAPDGGG